MRGWGLGAPLFAAVVISGCLGGDGLDDLAVSPAAPNPFPLSFGGDSGLPWTRETPPTLAAPPTWAVGEWWKVRLTTTAYAQTAEFRTVVVGVDGDSYLVGMERDRFEGLPLIMHSPALGEVSRRDLTYDAHDHPFQLLDFPLTQGKSWATHFWGPARTAALTVRETNETTATVEIVHPSGAVGRLRYDAVQGTIVQYELTTYRFEVVDHGFGFEGVVRVPARMDLVFCHGRTLVTTTIGAQCAAGGHSLPTSTVAVPAVYEAFTAALLLAPAPVPGLETVGNPLPYRLVVDTPSGERHEALRLPTEGASMRLIHGGDPAGSWVIEALAPGPGTALFEGVTYRVYDVELPRGCLRSPAPAGVQAQACPAG